MVSVETAKKLKKGLEKVFIVWIFAIVSYVSYLFTIEDHKNQIIELEYYGVCEFNKEHELCKIFGCKLCMCDTKGQIVEWDKQTVHKINTMIDDEDEENNLLSDDKDTYQLNMNSFLQGFPKYYDNNVWDLFKSYNIEKNLNPSALQKNSSIFEDIIRGMNFSIDIYSLYNAQKRTGGQSQIFKTKPMAITYFKYITNDKQKLREIYSYYVFYHEIMKEIIKSKIFKQFKETDSYFSTMEKHILKQSNLFKSNNLKQNLQEQQAQKIQEIFKFVDEYVNCIECERCKALIQMEYKSLEWGISILKNIESNSQYIDELKENQIKIILNAYEVIIQALYYTENMYEYYYLSRQNLGATLFSGSLFLLAFLKFAIEVRIQLKERVKRMFKHVFPKSFKED